MWYVCTDNGLNSPVSAHLRRNIGKHCDGKYTKRGYRKVSYIYSGDSSCKCGVTMIKENIHI